MTQVYVLIYLSSGKCYTYIVCRVWLWVSVFLEACGVLWFLNILCVVCFGVFASLYAWVIHTCFETCWCFVAGLVVGDVVSECRLNHYWPVICGPWGFNRLWPLGTRGLYRLGSVREWVFYCGGGLGYGIVHIPMDNTMTLLKYINNQSLLLPYESKPFTTIEKSFPLFQAVINP